MHSGAFLQSLEWEKFQNSLGRKTWRVDDTLIIKMHFISSIYFLYSPKIQEISIQKLEIRIREIAKKEKVIFWRIESQSEPPKNFIKIKDIQPRCTLITDISKSEEDLLAAMHEKTRYNIRLAAKKGIKISIPPFLPLAKGRSEERFDEFYKLLKQTSSRQDIKLHSREYYKKLAGFNEIFIACHENIPVACAMINFYEDTATYLHGGSDEKYKAMMAPHLLHWEIIKTAKSRGVKYYDWWGIDEKKWPGITRFKRGFGGEELCTPGTFDLPINKFLYKLYKLLRS